MFYVGLGEISNCATSAHTQLKCCANKGGFTFLTVSAFGLTNLTQQNISFRENSAWHILFVDCGSKPPFPLVWILSKATCIQIRSRAVNNFDMIHSVDGLQRDDLNWIGFALCIQVNYCIGALFCGGQIRGAFRLPRRGVANTG